MKKYFIILLFLAMAGCSSVANLKLDSYQGEILSTQPDKIEIYSTMDAAREYDIIGPVIAAQDAGVNAGGPAMLLQKEAAKLGADAVVDFRLEFEYGYWMVGIKASGYAVKYKN